jgi:hypothetical protein
MAGLHPFPAAAWLRRTTPASLRADLLAGLTNAAIVLPQGVAFATIAGLPPEYGLYTAMITTVIAALFGSSMVMISGPTTAISALLFASLEGQAAPGSARFIELALLMTLLVGAFQIIAGLVRLGGLVSFVSHSVIVAFTAAAALLIAVSQLAGAFGIPDEGGGNVIERLQRVIEAWPEMNPLALTIAAVTFATVAIVQTIAPRAPGFLFALVAGAALAAVTNAGLRGVEMLGTLPAALPTLAPPSIIWSDILLLAPAAAAVSLVGLLEAISIGRTFALKRREPFAPNQEIVGQGLSNAIGSFFLRRLGQLHPLERQRRSRGAHAAVGDCGKPVSGSDPGHARRLHLAHPAAGPGGPDPLRRVAANRPQGDPPHRRHLSTRDADPRPHPRLRPASTRRSTSGSSRHCQSSSTRTHVRRFASARRLSRRAVGASSGTSTCIGFRNARNSSRCASTGRSISGRLSMSRRNGSGFAPSVPARST